MKGFRVGVLAGGSSSEREISLRSGRAVCNALLSEGVDAIFLDVADNIHDIINTYELSAAFIALHGKFGEDGTVQRILASAGIPYTGSGPEASRLALDKIASKEIFTGLGIDTPAYSVAKKGIRFCCENFPVVVKPQFEGSSIGLSVVRGPELLDKALDSAFEFGDKVLIEEYIHGRELTVGVLDGKSLPVVEIVPKDRVYDYKAKYSDPDTQYLVPAPISSSEDSRARSLGLRAHNALGCRGFSRTDMILDAEGRIFVLEVNTIPGMTERSLLPKAANAAGIDFSKLCLKLVEGASI